MKESPAVYLGKIVDKRHFRVFVYDPTLKQKLIESWEDYEKHMETGIWFATKGEALISIVQDVEDEPIELPQLQRIDVSQRKKARK